MRWFFVAFVLFFASPAWAAGSWVISVSVDPDKTDIGNFSAVFTDTDTTVFTFAARAQGNAAGAQAFTNAAIAARNAWQTSKTRETTAINALVTRFTTAGETATGAPAQ